MDKGDLFMHCELHGASVCILKNPTNGIVPPLSIEAMPKAFIEKLCAKSC